MTTSGRYDFGAQTEIVDVIAEAYERVGLLISQLAENHYDSARRSLSYLFADWSNDGPNLWTLEFATLELEVGKRVYNLPGDTIYLVNVATRTYVDQTPTDLVIYAISRAEYLALPHKLQEGQRPTQFYFERSNPPVVYVWPVPQEAGVELLYYRMKIQQDPGAVTNTLDAPQRWMDAVASGLAARLAEKFAPDRHDGLMRKAEAAYGRAKREDRERVPLAIQPAIQPGWR